MAKKKELPKAQLGAIIKGVKSVGKAISTGKKIVGSTLSAAKKGYQENVSASKTGKKVKEWPSLDGTSSTKTKVTTSTKAKPAKEPMSHQKKKRIKQAAVVGTGAAIAGIKYANRDRRRLND
jgi:hypothetical protein